MYTNNLHLGKKQKLKSIFPQYCGSQYLKYFFLVILHNHIVSAENDESNWSRKKNQVAVTDFSAELSQVKNYTWFLKNIQYIGDFSSAKASSAFNL